MLCACGATRLFWPSQSATFACSKCRFRIIIRAVSQHRAAAFKRDSYISNYQIITNRVFKAIRKTTKIRMKESCKINSSIPLHPSSESRYLPPHYSPCASHKPTQPTPPFIIGRQKQPHRPFRLPGLPTDIFREIPPPY